MKKLSSHCLSIIKYRMLCDFCATLYTDKRLCLLYVAWLDRQEINMLLYLSIYIYIYDRLCGLVVRVSGYRYRGPGFDPRPYQIF